MRLWVIRTSLGLPPSISGSNCLCWWIWSSVSITEPSDGLQLDGGHAREQNPWINWQINLYIQRPLGSSLSAVRHSLPLLLKRTWITDAHTWYCHLLSLGESGNSVSLAQSYRSFVSAQTFPWLTTAWSSVWEGGKLKQERPVLILRYIKPLCAAFSPLLSQIWVKNSSGADVRGLQSWEYPSGVSGEGWPKERTVFFGL